MIFSSLRRGTLLAALCIALVPFSTYAQELWKVELESKATVEPIVADILESPGPETIVVMDNGTVRVILADGRSAWSAKVEQNALRTSRPCLVPASEGLSALLIVPISQSGVLALDCTTGEIAWRTDDLFTMNFVWCASADLDDDRVPEVIVSSMDGSVVALRTTDGAVFWRWPTNGRAPNLGSGPPCVADIDGDFAPEIYIPQDAGLLSLNARGEERFRTVSEGKPIDGPVVGDLDDNGHYEVYVAATGDAVEAFDADTGDALWRVVLPMCKGNGATLAIADLDQDDVSELIAWGTQANVISSTGTLLFQSTLLATGFAIGDANSDGEVELVGFAENKLVLFDAALGERARVELPTATERAPALVSLGGASVVYLGKDQSLRALRTGPRLMPQLSPWPQLRRDATGRAAALSAVGEANLHSSGPQLAASNASIGLSTGWDTQAEVDGWHGESDSRLELISEKKYTGTAALLVSPPQLPSATTRAVSATVPVEPSLRRVSATVLAHAPEGAAQAVLQWKRMSGEVVDQPLRATETTPEGWQRFRLSNASKPAGAVSLCVVLASDSAALAPVVWDDLQINAQYLSVPSVEIFWNQVGYEQGSPKRFTVATTFSAPEGKFRLLNETGGAVLEGTLDSPRRVVGAYSSDWGKFYWRGNFNDFGDPGRYQLEASIGGDTARSTTFEIGPDLHWSKVFATAVASLKGMRCDGGCPDAACLWRAGSDDDCAEGLESLRALGDVYGMIRWRYASKASAEAGTPALEDEIRWAGERLLPLCDAALAVGVQASAPLASAMASVALAIPEEKTFLEAARKLFDAGTTDPGATADPKVARQLYLAAVDLAAATGDASLMEAAKQRYPGPDSDAPETTARYDGTVDDMSGGTFQLGASLTALSDALLASADNPFGIPAHSTEGVMNYFETPPAGATTAMVGNSRFLLESARTVGGAYRFTTKPEYQGFIVDQLNWLLGNNPLGISMIEGLGTQNLPSYALGEGKGNQRAPGGAVARGTRAMGPGLDAPTLDLSGSATPEAGSNGVRAGDTVRLIEVIAKLKRIRFATRP